MPIGAASGISGTSRVTTPPPPPLLPIATADPQPATSAPGRGWIKVNSVTATPSGVKVVIDTLHSSNNTDTLALDIQAQVNGSWAYLGVFASGLQPNRNSPNGRIIVEIPTAWLKGLIAKYGVTNLQGINLEIGARWQTGHVWGWSSQGRPGGGFTWP